jgi:hypothetical protein
LPESAIPVKVSAVLGALHAVPFGAAYLRLHRPVLIAIWGGHAADELF